eukprot:TRINITY_DN71517_c0_g1_i1.p1 TRINITY_DN71517_c0_g1~~TRINITY_DN71517_c0_g1_i1.p1  ORF type:complete len:182 (+),score=45.74 TRINITY_DN71517_c0_g1_i1:101-646(+)
MATHPPTQGFSVVSALPAYHPILPNIAHVLTRVCAQGDSSPPPQHMSKWDTVQPAPVSVQDYLVRLCKYGLCSESVWVFICALVDRWSGATGRMITSYNVHKLLLTGFVIALKLRDDTYYSLAYYSRIGGVPQKELAAMEKEFLVDINFDLQFSEKDYAVWLSDLMPPSPSPEPVVDADGD